MKDRVLTLSSKSPSDPKSVLYIMSRDQRTRDNHALLLAQEEALKKELPLVVSFILLQETGHRSREHYDFMLDGLREVANELNLKNITFVLRTGSPKQEIAKLTEELHPASIYFDFSPLRGPRAMQKHIAEHTACSVYIVDTHNIIPTWVLSDKEEFAAHTIRRKIHKALDTWCVEPGSPQTHPHKFNKGIVSASWDEAHEFIQSIPKSGIKIAFKSGESAAIEHLRTFLSEDIDSYAAGRNDATDEAQSDLSPYLHYGQISSLRITLESLKVSEEPPFIFRYPKLASFEGTPTKQDGIDAFLEELIVRKELSDNFCFYQPHYDSLDGAKQWAKDTLATHANDPRDFMYTRDQFEASDTHDELWNAAQKQLIKSGKIHGYLRMYWAKKILEWSISPKEAVQIAVYLNDHYSIDGGDPNGYVGILWSIAGVHDRAWFERSVYGKIRYMALSGAKKRFSIDEYIQAWD